MNGPRALLDYIVKYTTGVPNAGSCEVLKVIDKSGDRIIFVGGTGEVKRAAKIGCPTDGLTNGFGESVMLDYGRRMASAYPAPDTRNPMNQA